VFDLDHTLYPASMALFDQINIRMSAFVMRALNVDAQEADHIRHTYWRAHGTTLAGLMAQHNIPPYPYLDEVHEIDFSILKPDPILADRITRLRGRRIVYTNGTADYARNVLHHRGLSGLFDAIYGVEDANYRPKPDPDAFAMIFG
jgi:putative hydrolase of the HAD superfamily